MRPVSDRQREALACIREGLTMRETCVRLGLASTNAVNDHVVALLRKGMIIDGDVSSRSMVRRYLITAAGLQELGLEQCSTCRGSGVVHRAPRGKIRKPPR